MDTSSISTEVAACTNARQQYGWPLELGYTDNVEAIQIGIQNRELSFVVQLITCSKHTVVQRVIYFLIRGQQIPALSVL